MAVMRIGFGIDLFFESSLIFTQADKKVTKLVRVEQSQLILHYHHYSADKLTDGTTTSEILTLLKYLF